MSSGLKFLNRGKERRAIQEVINRKQSGFIVLYGRRRVGKSRLLSEVKKSGDIYFLAVKKDARLQINDLADEISKTIPGFNDFIYPNFLILVQALNKSLKKNRTLILDEFNYFIESMPSLPSELQKFLDTEKNRKLNIIICGSYKKMMKELVDDYNAPLYGRADAILHIYPLKPGWIMEALDLDAVRAVEIYSVLGGIPKYWEHASAHNSKNVKSVVTKLLFEKNAILNKEPELILYEDFRNAVQLYSILSVIGSKTLRSGEIAARTGIERTSLTRPLSVLLDLECIEREVRFLDKPQKSKNTKYRISDPFISFYYRFMEPNRSELELELVDQTWDSVKEEIKTYISYCWEKLCRLSVPYLNTSKKKWRPAARWWGKGLDGNEMEIDVLAESFDRQHVLAGEVKWSSKVDANYELEKLKYKIKMLPGLPGNKKLIYVLFVKKLSDDMKYKDCILADAEIVMNSLKF